MKLQKKGSGGGMHTFMVQQQRWVGKGSVAPPTPLEALLREGLGGWVWERCLGQYAVAGGWGPTTSQATYHSASSAILPALGGDDSIDTKPETLVLLSRILPELPSYYRPIYRPPGTAQPEMGGVWMAAVRSSRGAVYGPIIGWKLWKNPRKKNKGFRLGID